jgi:excisionase family DNA binding protein
MCSPLWPITTTSALTRHVGAWNEAGVPVPAEVDEFAAFLAQSDRLRHETTDVRLRQERTDVAEDPERAESSPVADRLLVTKGEAVEQLGVSVRTVERLISAGRLLVVHVERAARVRASDLEAYVNDLPEGQSPPSGVDDPELRPGPEPPPRAR